MLSQGLRMAQMQLLQLPEEEEGYCSRVRKIEKMEEGRSRLEKFVSDLYANGRVWEYREHGLNFDFATVFQDEVSEEVLERWGWLFTITQHNPMQAWMGGMTYATSEHAWCPEGTGSRLFCVVADMYPNADDSFIEYGAVRLKGQWASDGDKLYPHKLEFAVAREEGKLHKYLCWLAKHCPEILEEIRASLALPREPKRNKLSPYSTSANERVAIRRLVRSFRWPPRLKHKNS